MRTVPWKALATVKMGPMVLRRCASFRVQLQASQAYMPRPRPQQRMFSSENGNDTDVFATEAEYHLVADESLEEIVDLLVPLEESDELGDNVDINYAQGVLNINLGTAGCWVLNKQTPNRQIWWSSPISGPRRYEFTTQGRTAEDWKCTRELDVATEGGNLRESLVLEIASVTGVQLDE